ARVGHLVALLGDDGDAGALDGLLEAAGQVLAEVVVLVEDGDLGVGLLLLEVGGVDAGLGDVVGLPADGPRVLGVGAPLGCAGGDEHLRNLALVGVVPGGGGGGGAERLEEREHLLLLDQAAGLLDGLGRLVAVVADDDLDLAAVDAALLVVHVV